MAEIDVTNKIIVKAPVNLQADYDYLCFSFNGKNSYEDFGLLRTSDGGKFEDDIISTLKDNSAEIPNSDGTYFFNSYHINKKFIIKFAFYKLKESKYREIKRWLSGKELAPLWFYESPYKVYMAKVTGQPKFNLLPLGNTSEERYYNGTGQVEFTAYWPYARTPDYVIDNTEATASEASINGKKAKDGRILSSYDAFLNKNEWALSSGLQDQPGICMGENVGELPVTFILRSSMIYDNKTTIAVGDVNVTIRGDFDPYKDTYKYKNLCLDSKTGIVKADWIDKTNLTTQKIQKPIPFIGNTFGKIPVDSEARFEFDKIEKLQDQWVVSNEQDINFLGRQTNAGIPDTELFISVKFEIDVDGERKELIIYNYSKEDFIVSGGKDMPIEIDGIEYDISVKLTFMNDAPVFSFTSNNTSNISPLVYISISYPMELQYTLEYDYWYY